MIKISQDTNTIGKNENIDKEGSMSRWEMFDSPWMPSW